MKYPVAGLDVEIELPVPLIQNIIPNTSFYNPYQRPGYLLRTPLVGWIQHETDNENYKANALMHKNWLFGGPVDQWGNREWVSFHFVVDDHEIRQFLPVNEVTWQAADGDGPGNWACISCELCVNSDDDEHKARLNAEALAAQILKAKQMAPGQTYRHWDFNYQQIVDRHYCPKHMMTENYWPTFLAHVKRNMQGGEPTTMQYPDGWDYALCYQRFGTKYAGYTFHENMPISTLWLDHKIMSACDFHFLDATTGRENFGFTSGHYIWRPNNKKGTAWIVEGPGA